MNSWQSFFKGKKVTQIGLGLLGRGIGDAEFLSEHSAELVVTDLKKKEDLELSIKKLARRPNITFVLGGHRLEDFRNRDFILKAAGVPLDSPYIAEAKKNGIPVEMDASLLAKLMPKGAVIIGVTGTRGKSTTTALIYECLRRAGKRVFLGGNIVPSATLPLIEKVREGDIAVLELDSWRLQGFGEAGFSPHVAVFTTFMEDHMNYYKDNMDAYFADKANIFKFQTKDDFLIAGEDIAELVSAKAKSKVIVARRENAILSRAGQLEGDHNRLNIACATEAAKVFGVTKSDLKGAILNFKGLPGRLQPVQSYKGVTIYNDTNATTPEATIAGLRAISLDKNVVLIMGGADKALDISALMVEIPKHSKAVVLLPGTGTDKMKDAKVKMQNENPELKIEESRDLKDAVEKALGLAKSGDLILFSPAFASFGIFKNEYDRGDKFMEIVRRLG